ncbi:MAG: YDG domain-containing protein [Gemmatimonadaceae bacterium]
MAGRRATHVLRALQSLSRLRSLLHTLALSFVLPVALATVGASAPLGAQNIISVPFTDGFIGTRGSSAGTANNVLTFGTLEIWRIFFIQNSSTNSFELQGNDIPGTLRIVRVDGTFIDMPASCNWRNSGGSTYLIGILPRPVSPVTLNYTGGSIQITDGSNSGGSSLGGYIAGYAGVPLLDGDNTSGNAAQSQVLSGLNSYLTTVVAQRPAGPVTVNTLSTTNTSPTLSGSATLAGGEDLTVSVNGVEYSQWTFPQVQLSGNSWTLTPNGPLATGTYSVTATITNLQGYTLSDGTVNELTITPTVTTITLGGSFTANDKTYSGTTAATGSTGSLTLVGVNGGDQVSISSATLAFQSAGVGSGKTVTITGVTLGGANAANYAVSLVGAPTATAAINAKGLTISGVSAANKVYDGGLAASLSGTASYVGLVNGENYAVTGTPSASFGTATVGNGKAVTVAGYTAPSANYTVSQPSGLTANIMAKPLTVSGSFTANDKMYDGTTSATIATNALGLTGVVSGDVVTITGTTVAFASAAVGNGKTVSLTAASLSGADASNYSLSLVGAPTTTANITPAGGPVTIGGSFTADDKTYDALTSATGQTGALTLVGVNGAHQVSIASVTLAFQTAPAGSGKTVVIAGVTLGGADAALYTVDLTGAPSATAAINAKGLTITGISAANKVYDGNATASLTGSASYLGLVAGENYAVTGTPSASFASAAVATGVAVTVSGFTAPNSNYTLTQPSGLTANITTKSLAVGGSFTANDKTYDGGVSATIGTNTLALTGIVGSDNVTVAGQTAAFLTAPVGIGKTVAITGITLGGSDAAYYTVDLSGAPTTTAAIAAKGLTIGGSFTASNKVYDGSATATIASNALTLVGVVGGDNVSLTGLTAAFASAAIGNGRTVSLSAASLTGGDATNYTLSLTGAPTATANITFAGATVTVGGSFSASNKAYDALVGASGNTSALTLSGVAPGHTVSIASVTLAFATPTVGGGKTVSIANLTLGGADAALYAVNLNGAPTATASISPRSLTVSGLRAASKVFDGSSATSLEGTAAYVGLVAGEQFPVAGASSAVFATPDVGNGKPVTVSGIEPPSGNYVVAQPLGLVANVTPKGLTIGGHFVAADREYDGTVHATIATQALTLLGVVNGGAVSLAGVTAAFADPAVGNGKPVALATASLAGPGAPNYTLSMVGAPTATANILPSVPPGAPRDVHAAAGDRTLSVTWTPPAAVGCAAVTSYRLQYSGDRGQHWTDVVVPAGASMPVVVNGVANNTTYLVRVAAINRCGPGPEADAPEALIPLGVTRDGSGTPVSATPGGSTATAGGQPVPSTLDVVQDSVVRVTSGDVAIELAAVGVPGEATPVDSSRTLQLEDGGHAVSRGRGFAPGTYASLYLFPPSGAPRLLGTVLVSSDGDFHATFPIPEALASGPYTLQVNGVDRMQAARAFAVGVEIAEPPPTLVLSSVPDIASPTPGDTITITLTVTNEGRGPAIDVAIPRAFEESGFTFVRATPADGRYDASTHTWRIPRIDAGAKATLLLTVIVLAPTASQGSTP